MGRGARRVRGPLRSDSTRLVLGHAVASSASWCRLSRLASDLSLWRERSMRFPWIAVALVITCAQTAFAQTDSGATFVPDVIGQFNALSVRPDPLGFFVGDSVPPNTCKHYEGIVRAQGADGTPYLMLTRSGNQVFPCVLQNDVAGGLIVVKMASREKHPERMRSNRLRKATQLTDTAPPPEDVVATEIRFAGDNGWPHYGHPESMQTIGDIVVLGVDSPLGSETEPMQVLFIDVANPENPQLIRSFKPGNPEINGGVVAIAPYREGRDLLGGAGG